MLAPRFVFGGSTAGSGETVGHGRKTVRDREDEGSNPSPPAIFVFKIGDFGGRLPAAEHRRITISRGATKSRSSNGAVRLPT
jgi:hypothetical protein